MLNGTSVCNCSRCWLFYTLDFGLPLMPAAFAIAAILCPTDAVAVSAITRGKLLPKGSMTILEGESLLNDAAGTSFHLKLLLLH